MANRAELGGLELGRLEVEGEGKDRDEELAALREKVRRLEKINAALIDRVERSSDIQGGAYSMFETAISLEAMVRDRTQALEEALSRLNVVNSELQAAHADANAARSRLRDAIESLSDGFALFDGSDRMIMCNKAFLEIWPDFEPMAHNGPEFSELVSAAADKGRTMGSLLERERWVSERVDRHRRADGAHVQALSDGRWIQINEMRTSEGGIVGIYTDITSVKAEDARERARELAERNLSLQATLDTLSEGVCLFDAGHRLQAWNGVLLRMLGIGQQDVSRIATHAALRAWCVESRKLECEAGLTWRDREGSRASSECMMGGRHFVIRSVPLSSGGMVFTFDDVTDRVRFQRSLTETAETLERRVAERTAELVRVNRELIDAKNEAEQANRSKTSFIAAASHDLLQPLNAARLFVSALEGRPMASRSRSLVDQTSTALDSVEDLLEALFEISRLDAGAIQPEISRFPLDHILSALRTEFTPLATRAHLRFSVPETGLWVQSDPRLLRRVLQNFVSNAIRYTQQGCVTVELEQKDSEVVVTVRDTGPGIAPENRERIFEEFRRLGSTQGIPGKGLGLAIVRRVTTMLGHEISVDTEVGKGSAFSITLPFVEPEAVTEEEAQSVPEAKEKAGGLVLVVDNDASILAGMEALLENWGLEVIAVSDPAGKAATRALEQGPALLMVNYHLDNDLTGVEAIAGLRQRAGTAIPALVITADRGEETKALLAAEGLPLLNKPVKPAQLRALLRQLDIL
ncbi:hybrid sensor histidine kinase/response regulator [Croceicoccus mobilis]|uniref:hybrid sensor histidine kinase/response regulator n=1 Tax=Croceicoccus mobilis TaxID=1703339 RepID=UPI0009ED36A8|nr:NahK/ErcS family hybrid sensor histidine kinase/response regulator [Croceicoccus mobilis]